MLTGIILNLLEEAVIHRFGAETWREMLQRTGAVAYLPFDRYEDQELFPLLEALPLAAGNGRPDRLHWFGRATVPLLAERYPGIFEAHRSAESFLLSLNAVLHPDGPPKNAGAPNFEVTTGPGPGLVLTYRSTRRLCALAEGFVQGTAAYFGQDVFIEQPRCALRGRKTAAWSARSPHAADWDFPRRASRGSTPLAMAKRTQRPGGAVPDRRASPHTAAARSGT